MVHKEGDALVEMGRVGTGVWVEVTRWGTEIRIFKALKLRESQAF